MSEIKVETDQEYLERVGAKFAPAGRKVEVIISGKITEVEYVGVFLLRGIPKIVIEHENKEMMFNECSVKII